MITAQAEHHCEVQVAVKDASIIGAYLWYDGYVALPDKSRYIPITEILYTEGRPEREAVPGGTSYCIPAGGIPLLSDRLYRALVSLGAEGTVGEVVYRGFSKKDYDTPQRGVRRFVPTPAYSATHELSLVAELPEELPRVFAIVTTCYIKRPTPRTQTEIHIGLSAHALNELACELPHVLVAPLKKRG